MNKKNRNKTEDFSSVLSEIEKIIGYRFKDKSLITQAFTRSSFCNEHKGADSLPYQSNEVLEFFGDGVLSAAIISIFMKDLSERYPHGIKTDLGEGDFSNIKSRLSDKKNLSDRIEELGLYKYLRMGEGDKKLGIAREPSVMEDLFESIIGAIYIDSAMDIRVVIDVVARMLDVKKYLTGPTRDKNSAVVPPIQSYKNALQEWCADKRRRLPAPVYETISESGPDHKKVYERACYIGERRYSVGVGKNQKLADAAAAEQALLVLMAEEKGTSPVSASQKDVKTTVPKAQKNKAETDAPVSRAQLNKAHTDAPVSRAQNDKGLTDLSLPKAKNKNKDEPKPIKASLSHIPDKEAEAKLKAYAKSEHIAPPLFRDMGECEASGRSIREYSVLCRLADIEAVGVGSDKSTARMLAAESVLMLSKKKNEKEKQKVKVREPNAPTRVNKNAKKSDKRRLYRKGTGKR